MHLTALVASHRDELVALRRDFHRHPELGFQERRTAGVITQYLAQLGFEVRAVAKTGVIGILRGCGPGKTLMLRADMDALPVQEATGLPYASEHAGVMHACGHDGHMAMLLVAAKILCSYRDRIKGNIKFVFQPNEEDAGAQAMIDEGVLAGDPAVDAALALHLWAPLPTGLIGAAAGPVMASSDYFHLTIRGQGGHGGAPHTAVDPVLCAAEVIQSVQAVQTREISVLKSTLITFCKVHGGSSPIIIPEEVVLEGSIRCLHESSAETKARFAHIVDGVCRTHRTDHELEIVPGNSLLVNDPGLIDLVRETAAGVVGAGNCTTDEVRMMIGEDFAEFASRLPGAMYLVGAGGVGGEKAFPHHHPRFDIDEDALPIGVEMHVRTTLRFLTSGE